jgi:hypothetical protein
MSGLVKGCCGRISTCCRCCAAVLAQSSLITQALLAISILSTAGIAIFSLAVTSKYSSTMTAWRTVQGAITCGLGIYGAYGVHRHAKFALWLCGFLFVVSGLVFFAAMCADADIVGKVQACGTDLTCYQSLHVETGMTVLDAVLVVLLILTGTVALERRKVHLPSEGAPATGSGKAAASAVGSDTPLPAAGKPKSMGERLFGGGGGGAGGESV